MGKIRIYDMKNPIRSNIPVHYTCFGSGRSYEDFCVCCLCMKLDKQTQSFFFNLNSLFHLVNAQHNDPILMCLAAYEIKPGIIGCVILVINFICSLSRSQLAKANWCLMFIRWQLTLQPSFIDNNQTNHCTWIKCSVPLLFWLFKCKYQTHLLCQQGAVICCFWRKSRIMFCIGATEQVNFLDYCAEMILLFM